VVVVVRDGRGQVGDDVWMTTVDSDDLPALHTFVHVLRMDLPAVIVGLTPPYRNGPVEGANTKVLKRQMYGRAEFPCYANGSCSHRSTTGTTGSVPEPFVLQSRTRPCLVAAGRARAYFGRLLMGYGSKSLVNNGFRVRGRVVGWSGRRCGGGPGGVP
jgi:hypothetical protein